MSDDRADALIALPQLYGNLLGDHDFPADPAAAAEARRRGKYGNLWLLAASGEFPTERHGRGVFVRGSDRPQAAQAIGLCPRRPASTPVAAE